MSNLKGARITKIAADQAFVGKRFRLDDDGRLVKESAGAISSGSARTIDAPDAEALASVIIDLAPNEAISLGTLSHDGEVRMVARHKLSMTAEGSDGTVARTKDHFRFDEGRGWLLLDVDIGGAPSHVVDRISELGGIAKSLSHIWPDLRSAEKVLTRSSSSGIQLPGGTLTSADHSRHVFVLIDNVTEAQEYLRRLFHRAWMAGLGWIALSKSGQRLQRAIVDVSVASPERLIFETPPVLMDGLIRTSVPPKTWSGIAVPMPEDVDATTLIASEMEKLRPAADEAEKAFTERQVERVAAESGVSWERATQIVRERLEGRLLSDDDVLENAARRIRVSDLLNGPAVQQSFADPVEGLDYGTTTATYLPADSRFKVPVLVSHAHGLRTIYRFARFARKATDTTARKPRQERATVTQTADEASGVAAGAIARFFDEAIRSGDPVQHLIRADMGVGKTRGLVRKLAEIKTSHREFRTLIRTPSHKLASQLIEDLTAAGVAAGVYLGVARPDPSDPSHTVCRRLEDYQTVRAAGGSLGDLCGSNKRGYCRHHPKGDGPTYWHKQADLREAQVVVVAGDVSLTRALPKSIKRKGINTDDYGLAGKHFNALVIDETSPAELVAFGDDERNVAVDIIRAAGSFEIRNASLHTAEYADLAALLDALRHALKDTEGHPTVAGLSAAGVDAERLVQLRGLVWRCAPKLNIDPAMSGDALGVCVRDAATRYADVRAVVHLIDALEQGLEDAAEDPDARIAQVRVHRAGGKGGSRLVAGVMYRATLAGDIAEMPTAILDATPQIDLLRRWWPKLEQTADAAAVDGPGCFRVQVIGDAWSYFSSVPSHATDDGPIDRIRRAALWSIMSGALAGGQAAFIGPKRAVEIGGEIGLLNGIETAHFGAVRGLNTMETAGSLVVYGRQLPSTIAIERLGAVILGRQPDPELGAAPLLKCEGEIRLRDGAAVTTLETHHPDPQIDLVVSTTARAERAQAAERARGVRRQIEKPVVVTLLGDGDVGRPVDYVASFDEWQAATSWVGFMLASGCWPVGRGRPAMVRQWLSEGSFEIDPIALGNRALEDNDAIAIANRALEQNDVGTENIAIANRALENALNCADRYIYILENRALERLQADPLGFIRHQRRHHPDIAKLMDTIDAAFDAAANGTGPAVVHLLGVPFDISQWKQVKLAPQAGERYGRVMYIGPGFGFRRVNKGES